jgi:predicted nuclease with TOPRIM domain
MSEEQNIEPDVKQESVTQDAHNVPLTRLNEVITERNELRDQMKAFATKEEDQRRAKLQEEEKWQELNSELVKEVDSYKGYKEKWEDMDNRLRETALARLPESKREKFASVDTDILLNIVEEFSEVEKQNPPDRKGTVPSGTPSDWVAMPDEQRRSNWQAILDSYIKR